MPKTTINFDVELGERKSTALELPDKEDVNKIYFSATLCHAMPRGFAEGNYNELLPIANENNETFLADKEELPEGYEGFGLQEAVDTAIDASGNLFHDPDLTVGHSKDAVFVDEKENECARIDFTGVAQRDLLKQWGVEKKHLEEKQFAISMEVYYDDWFYIWGEEIVGKDEMPELEEYVNDMYENKGVIRVITNPNFSAWSFIESGFQADDLANIKAVAQKEKRKSKFKEEENMYKEFETEEEFNEFMKDKRESIAAELKEDDDFLEDVREGYIAVANVLDKFEEMELAEADTLDEAMEEVSEVKSEYKDLQESLAEAKEINEKKEKLAEANLKLEDLDMEEEEELLEMSEASLDTIISVAKKKEEEIEEVKQSQASQEKENDFDPNANVVDEDESLTDVVDAL